MVWTGPTGHPQRPEQLGGQQESKLVTAGAFGTKGKAFFKVQNDALRSTTLNSLDTKQPVISKRQHVHSCIVPQGSRASRLPVLSSADYKSHRQTEDVEDGKNLLQSVRIIDDAPPWTRSFSSVKRGAIIKITPVHSAF